MDVANDGIQNGNESTDNVITIIPLVKSAVIGLKGHSSTNGGSKLLILVVQNS